MEDLLRSWVPLLVSIIALGTSGWGILQGPARKNAEAIKQLADSMTRLIDKLDGRLDVAERELEALKITVTQLPTRDDFHGLDRGLTEVKGKIETITKSQQAAEFALQRIEGYLINRAEKAG